MSKLSQRSQINTMARWMWRTVSLMLWAVGISQVTYAQTNLANVRIIVPVAAGTGLDATARAVGDGLSKVMARSVVIDNMAGAGGVLGTSALVRQPKDGLTLAMVGSGHTINPSIYKQMPFDPIQDITPITVVGTVPIVLLVRADLPAKNARELVELLKKSPGKYTFGSGGNGSVMHLAGALFASEAGVSVQHIPYRALGAMTSDLAGGQIDMAYLAVSAAAPLTKTGKIRAIAVTTPYRSPLLPDVPSLKESGLPRYSYDAWIALIGPAGLDKAMVAKYHTYVKVAIARKEVQEALTAQGVSVIANSPSEADAFFKADIKRQAQLVKASGAIAE